eukprot:5687703-Pleurochrysis_carterae.AAC.7
MLQDSKTLTLYGLPCHSQTSRARAARASVRMLSSGGVSDGQAAKLRAYERKQAAKRARLQALTHQSDGAKNHISGAKPPPTSLACQALATAIGAGCLILNVADSPLTYFKRSLPGRGYVLLTVAFRSVFHVGETVQTATQGSQTHLTCLTPTGMSRTGDTQTPNAPPITISRVIWRTPVDKDVETMATVQAEVNASLSLHCRHMTKECLQEPMVTLRGLAGSGIERYFCDWSSRKVRGATVSSPEQLHSLLAKKQWHRWSAGCCNETTRQNRGACGAQRFDDTARLQSLVQTGGIGPYRSRHSVQGARVDREHAIRASSELCVRGRGASPLQGDR